MTPLEILMDEKKFHGIKNRLHNSAGKTYTDFKRTLQPDYLKVWNDIIFGWAGMILIMAISLTAVQYVELPFKIIISVLAAVAVGYLIAYLVNFFHEAAHYNIARNKKTNDWLANLFIGILIGQGIRNYRIVHWQHHVALGTTADTERSYFESLNLRFFLYSLTGLSAITFLINRNAFIPANSKGAAIHLKKEKLFQLIFAMLFHFIILAALFWFHAYWAMATWVLAIASFYPFFNRLRQLIEHRSDKADKSINYTVKDHGKINRLFGNSFFDKSFGSAGFNKHMLHHLEPSVSYTRLNELESFLKETILSEPIRNQRTTYFTTFKKLLNK